MRMCVCSICNRYYVIDELSLSPNDLKSRNVCPDCVSCGADKFSDVKEYVWEHPGCTITEVSMLFEVKAEVIRLWVREGHFEIIDRGLDGLTCIKCGVSIISGYYCQKCLKKELGKGVQINREIEKHKQMVLYNGTAATGPAERMRYFNQEKLKKKSESKK